MLFDLIRDLPRSGGFSYDLATGRVATDGYMVALTGHTVQVPLSATTSELVAAVTSYISHNLAIFADYTVYLGGWIQDGQLWLEPARLVKDLATAIELGRTTDQIAIFDVLAESTIDTGGNGGI
jgi:hypothetical protein